MILPTQGNPIDKHVQDAIDQRVKALKERAGGTSENLQAINYYFTNRTPWVRMVSSVDTAEHGSQLAKDNVLGMIQDTNDSRMPSGTEISEEFGIRPKAGITNMQVTSLGAFGALRDITITFTCFSKEQLDTYEKLFMRPGASVLIEWGHSLYLTEQGDSIKVNQMGPGYQKMFDGNKKTIIDVYKDIQALRKIYNYEYDGAFGLIKNFSWNFEGAGPTYECRVVVGSCGEVIGSLQSQLPLPDLLAQKYKDQNRYSDRAIPDQEEFIPPPDNTVDAARVRIFGADYNPYDIQTGLGTTVSAESIQSDQTDIGLQQEYEKKGEYVQQRVEDVANKFVPFLDGRTDWEVSSMLKTFLYQDLICVYHIGVLSQARRKILADNDLALFDRTSKPNPQSTPAFTSYAHLTQVIPRQEQQDSDSNTWLINKLGYRAHLLTLFFREEEEEALEDLTDEDLAELGEDEIATYERYRAMSYIRYADLLSFFNNTTLFDKSGPLLTFDTSTQGDMYYNDFVQSLDPRICLLPSDVSTILQNTSINFKKGEDYTRIGDIALNVAKLYEIAENTRGSIKDYLDGVNSEIAKATGQMVDLDVAYQEESAKYFIVDRRSYSGQEIPSISILGTDTIVRNFNLATSISNDLSSAVAISLGEARGNTPRSDISKTLLNFHKGITDRNMPTRDEYPPSITKTQEKVSGDYQDTQTKTALIDITLKSLYQHRLFSDELTNNLVNLFPKYIVEQAPASALGGVILPYTLSLTVDGLSGFRVMDSFQIATDLLPSSYVKSSKVANLITGVEAQVSKAGWTVNLKSRYYNKQEKLRDLRIKKYKVPEYNYDNVLGGIFNTIQHNGVVIYSTDPNHPTNNLIILKQWVRDNFNHNIQAQAIGMLVNLAKKLINYDNFTGAPEDMYGYSVIITSAFRSLDKQKSLRKAYQEALKKGTPNPIPAAPPGKSMHNWGGAIDFNIINTNNGQSLYNSKTSQAEWDKLKINSIIGKFGFEYGIKNDPIHIEYSANGTTVLTAYNTGKVENPVGNPITDSSGKVINTNLHPRPEIAVDLTKFATVKGLELPEYQPQGIELQYLENINSTQGQVNSQDATQAILPELLGAEDVTGRVIEGLPTSIID